jgi:hypothetical protein
MVRHYVNPLFSDCGKPPDVRFNGNFNRNWTVSGYRRRRSRKPARPIRQKQRAAHSARE